VIAMLCANIFYRNITKNLDIRVGVEYNRGALKWSEVGKYGKQIYPKAFERGI